MSSVADLASSDRRRLSTRVGAAFRLLMLVRLFVAAVTLALIPVRQLDAQTFLLVIAVIVLSWLMAKYWSVLLPWILAHPVLVALDVMLSFVVLEIGGPSGPFLLSTVATAAISGLLFRWRGMLAVSVLQVLCYYLVLVLTLDRDHVDLATFQTILGQPLYYPLVGFAGAALRRLLDDQEEQETARRTAEVNAAAAEERTRLAREIHDSLAKTLRGISLTAAALPLWVKRDPARAKAEALQIAAAIEIASREARGLISGLRDESVIRSLPAAAGAAVERWREEHGDATLVHCDIDERADLPLRARYEAIAILGEALANIARHAEATRVHIGLAVDAETVVLTIRDDGRGFEPVALRDLARDGHYGLVGLHERAENVGGCVRLASRPGEGTTVTVRIPAAEAAPRRFAEVS